MSEAMFERLTRELCARPGDAQALLVYADFLDEAGDARGAYVRHQAALRTAEGPARADVLRALRRVYPADHPAWLAELEEAGAFEANLTPFEAAWFGTDLPGRPARGTYEVYPGAELPALPYRDWTGDLAWLRETPPGDGESPAATADAVAWGAVLDALVQRGFFVPAALRVILTDESLQGRIPSCTANYFVPAPSADALPALDDGAFYLRFYSDQQDVVEWGVRLCRGEPYVPVLSAVPEWADDEVRRQQFQFAAPTVETYLYRTWIENRIWFAAEYSQTRRELAGFELAYLERYAPR